MSKQIQEAYIVAATRTPVAKRNGMFRNVRPDDMLAHVLRSVVARVPGLDATEIGFENHVGCTWDAGVPFAFVPVADWTMVEGVIWMPEQSRIRVPATCFGDRILARPGEPVAAGQPMVRTGELAEHWMMQLVSGWPAPLSPVTRQYAARLSVSTFSPVRVKVCCGTERELDLFHGNNPSTARE